MRKRRDKNHNQIKQALTKIGCSVFDTADVGKGFPDLIVGIRGYIFIVEIKNKDNWYGKKGLSKTQIEFAETWRGSEPISATTPEDAVTKISLALNSLL